MKQSQFLEVLDRDEAERRWRAVVRSTPLEPEVVVLDQALGRVLAEDVRAEVDVPGFDRANMDGFGKELGKDQVKAVTEYYRSLAK